MDNHPSKSRLQDPQSFVSKFSGYDPVKYIIDKVSLIVKPEGSSTAGLSQETIGLQALELQNQLAEAREVKFVQILSKPLSIGSHIICQGTPCKDLPWFAINIGTGDPDSGRGDICVHFNVRLPQHYVVRNTRRNNRWGSEETTAYRQFPFLPNREFSIEVLVDEKETLWAVDGEDYCNYVHRSPSPFTATWIQVTGVRDAALKIKKTNIYPTLAPDFLEVPLRPSLKTPAENDEPTWRPNITATLTNGIPEGHQIVVYGRLRPLLHSFVIDLMDATNEWPRPNIQMHVNLRAHDDAHLERQLIVLNTWLGDWGQELRQRTARFIPGTYTTFRIIRGQKEWSIYAEDKLIGELEHRASPEAVKAVRIRGDIFPEQIYLCPATSSPTRDDS